MKLNSIELTEMIKANYEYEDSKEYYEIQDILMTIDKLLKRDDIDREKLLNLLERVEANER